MVDPLTSLVSKRVRTGVAGIRTRTGEAWCKTTAGSMLWGLNPHQVLQGPLAQLVEHPANNGTVDGSSPSGSISEYAKRTRLPAKGKAPLYLQAQSNRPINDYKLETKLSC